MDKGKEVIDLIMSIDEANKICVDCESEFVTHVSINNGVTLCEPCSIIHAALGISVSYIRQIADEWDNYLYDYFVFGSNSRFIHCLKSFSIENSMETNLKYKTVASDFYRRSLRAKVLKLKSIDDIDRAMGKKILENQEEANNEFAGYQVKTQLTITPFTKMQGFFFGKVGRTFEGMNIMDKVKTGGQKTWENMKKGGQFVSEKTAPATNKVKQGASYVSNQVKNAYTDLKDKIIKKGAPENVD